MKKLKKVLVGGCFDILHYGHFHYLKRSSELGNFLIVAIESDKNISKLKGTGRPFHSQDKRREMLMSLKFVNEVIILKNTMKNKDYLDLVVKEKPDVIAVTKGDPIVKKKRSYAKVVGARLIEIPRVEVASTTKIAQLLELE